MAGQVFFWVWFLSQPIPSTSPTSTQLSFCLVFFLSSCVLFASFPPEFYRTLRQHINLPGISSARRTGLLFPLWNVKAVCGLNCAWVGPCFASSLKSGHGFCNPILCRLDPAVAQVHCALWLLTEETSPLKDCCLCVSLNGNILEVWKYMLSLSLFWLDKALR